MELMLGANSLDNMFIRNLAKDVSNLLLHATKGKNEKQTHLVLSLVTSF